MGHTEFIKRGPRLEETTVFFIIVGKENKFAPSLQDPDTSATKTQANVPFVLKESDLMGDSTTITQEPLGPTFTLEGIAKDHGISFETAQMIVTSMSSNYTNVGPGLFQLSEFAYIEKLSGI